MGYKILSLVYVCFCVSLQCKNESVSAMTRVLVGVEMFLCNSHPRQMEFSVPSLSAVRSVSVLVPARPGLFFRLQLLP